MGGGDVKLMAGFGAVLGVGRVAEAAFWTALVGGLLAAGALGVSWAWARAARRGAPGPVAIPYAPAIVAGVLLTLVGNK
jgi:prepilin peptidase CpaA